MDLIPPLCYYLFSLPIKPDYIIPSFIVGARNFFSIVSPYNSRKQPYNIYFPTMLYRPKMIPYFINQSLKPLPTNHNKGNFNKAWLY